MDAIPKYTKFDSFNNKFRGWDRQELIIWNVLFRTIKIHRGCDESKEMEIEMKSIYVKMARKLNENNNGDSENTDTDDSHSDDLEVYSSFSSVFQLSQATCIT